MAMLQRVLPSLALVLALVQCGTADPRPVEPQASPRHSDPQSTVEPRSEPGVGQAFLARMVGEWSVAKTFHGRDGSSASSSGECRQTMVHSGRFLLSEFILHSKDGDSTGTGMIGFDARSGRFTSFWIDSRSTNFSIRQSVADFDGQKIELRGKALEGAPPARESRTETILEDGDRRIVHRQFSTTTGQPERLVMEMVLTRRG